MLLTDCGRWARKSISLHKSYPIVVKSDCQRTTIYIWLLWWNSDVQVPTFFKNSPNDLCVTWLTLNPLALLMDSIRFVYYIICQTTKPTLSIFFVDVIHSRYIENCLGWRPFERIWLYTSGLQIKRMLHVCILRINL